MKLSYADCSPLITGHFMRQIKFGDVCTSLDDAISTDRGETYSGHYIVVSVKKAAGCLRHSYRLKANR
jgi:hypothetical protein